MVDMNNLKILLVEDSKIVQKTHTRMLRELSCIVEIAEDGQKALSMGQGDYAIIFMDIGLPYLSGIEVASQLRQLGIKTPIIGLTAYDLEEIEEQCLSAGINKVIIKPVSQLILQSVIKDHVNSNKVIDTNL